MKDKDQSQKLRITWRLGDEECEDCGVYDSGEHLLVQNAAGETLLWHCADDHLGGFPVYSLSQAVSLIEQLLTALGYSLTVIREEDDVDAGL